MSQESPRIYRTSEVASRLGISTSLLRRYGLAWERVQGESLPQLPGLGRLYPEDVVENLLEAHAWSELRPEASVEEALRAVLGVGAAQGANAELAEAVQESVQRALSPLLVELHVLKSELRALRARLDGAPATAPTQSAASQARPAPPARETEQDAGQATEQRTEQRSKDQRNEPAEAERTNADASPQSEPGSDFSGESAPARPPQPNAPDWDFSLQGPPVPAPKLNIETRKGYPPEPWPAPWRVQPRPEGESQSDFEALEEDFADERERDEQDKGFVNWFKRNF